MDSRPSSLWGESLRTLESRGKSGGRRFRRSSIFRALVPAALLAGPALREPLPGGEIGPEGAAAYFDFRRGLSDLAHPGRSLLLKGARHGEGVLETQDALGHAELEAAGMAEVSQRLDGIKAMTAGGWFFCRRSGEQVLFSRGLPQIAPLGERMFPPSDRFVNFCLGTDQHGFFLGTIHGNGKMPFPLVTLNEVPPNAWCQLVVVKDPEGYQKLYPNGSRVHTDRDSAWSGQVRPFREAGTGEPLRLSVPLGGLVGEAWIFPRELGE